MSEKIDFGSNEEFIKKYDELKSARKVGEYYGCSKTTVLRHVKEIGYDVNSNKSYKLTDEDKQYIISAYEKETSTELAKKFNVSRGMITKLWYEQNLKGKQRDYSNAGNNLLGQTFGYLTVIATSPKRDAAGGKFWKCSCNCGCDTCKKEVDVSGSSLLEKRTISCGTIGKENLKIGQGLNFQDLTGQRFGKITVIERCEDKEFKDRKAVQYKCICDCGKITKVLSSNLISGNTQSCGCCGNNSHGNIKIEEILKNNNIIYEREKRFLTCKDKQMLPFDFYIPEKNYLIEYDGKQHFSDDSFFSNEMIKIHDEMKDLWCKENNIPLIRIPYSHFNKLVIEDLKLETSQFIIK